jgi:hypothetical protein
MTLSRPFRRNFPNFRIIRKCRAAKGQDSEVFSEGCHIKIDIVCNSTNAAYMRASHNKTSTGCGPSETCGFLSRLFGSLRYDTNSTDIISPTQRTVASKSLKILVSNSRKSNLAKKTDSQISQTPSDPLRDSVPGGPAHANSNRFPGECSILWYRCQTVNWKFTSTGAAEVAQASAAATEIIETTRIAEGYKGNKVGWRARK